MMRVDRHLIDKDQRISDWGAVGEQGKKVSQIGKRINKDIYPSFDFYSRPRDMNKCRK